MSAKARQHGLTLRPHFKTHQSHEIGRWFRDDGVDRITVSSLTMAEYFANDGWNDITVAFPVNTLEEDTIHRLAEQIQLNLLVESTESVRALDSLLQNPVDVWIKIDVGYHRTGIDAEDTDEIARVVEAIESSSKLRLEGLLTHAGHSYDARGASEILRVHTQSVRRISDIRQHLATTHPDLLVSVGDTPTCSVADDFAGVDEIRPGNYVFYDVSQWHIGSCALDEIAVAMACPVVAIHRDRGEVVLYGGGVHFSKDRAAFDDGTVHYGLVTRGRGWQLPDHPVSVRSLSQEHGIVQADSEFLSQVEVGDIVTVLPVHSCMTANLAGQYTTLQGRVISRL